jgi:hypothetical protein
VIVEKRIDEGRREQQLGRRIHIAKEYIHINRNLPLGRDNGFVEGA